LFIGITNTVTTSWKTTVKSACIRNRVGVAASIITFLSSLLNTVSTLGLAVGIATIIVDFVSIVTGLTVGSVDHSVSTDWKCAAGSTAVWCSVAVSSTEVTFLIEVNDTITTSEEFAVGSAFVGLRVRVVWSIVALFVGIENTVSALLLAVGITTITRSVISVITGFTVEAVSDSITTEWKNAVGSARVGLVGVPFSLVASFARILDTITTVWKSAVGTASARCVVVVVLSTITLLLVNVSASGPHDVFLLSISALASGELRETVENWVEESIS
jgi:hypothetical protein